MNALTKFRWWSPLAVAGFALLTWAILGYPTLGPLPNFDQAAYDTLFRAGWGLLALGLFGALVDGIIRAIGTPPHQR